MIESFGQAPNGHIRAALDMFLAELMNEADGTGIVYLYGTPAQVAARTRLIKNHFGFRGVPLSRVAFIARPNNGGVRSDLWLIPKGAEPPEIKAEAWIEVEFGRTYRNKASSMLDKFLMSLTFFPDHNALVVNYGSPEQVAIRERWLSDRYKRRPFDPSRITLVNGGPGPVRTVMWLVPPGAENPTP